MRAIATIAWNKVNVGHCPVPLLPEKCILLRSDLISMRVHGITVLTNPS